MTNPVKQSNPSWERHCADIRHAINGHFSFPTMSHWEWVEAYTQLIMTAVSNKNKLFFFFSPPSILACSTSTALLSERWPIAAEVRQRKKSTLIFPSIRKTFFQGRRTLFLFPRLLRFTSGVNLETNSVKLCTRSSREPACSCMPFYFVFSHISTVSTARHLTIKSLIPKLPPNISSARTSTVSWKRLMFIGGFGDSLWNNSVAVNKMRWERIQF